jgi:hypothetical protein
LFHAHNPTAPTFAGVDQLGGLNVPQLHVPLLGPHQDLVHVCAGVAKGRHLGIRVESHLQVLGTILYVPNFQQALLIHRDEFRTEWKYNMNITAMATVHPLQLVPPPPGVDLLPSCYKDQIAVSCQSCNAPRVKLGHGQQPQLAGHLGVESTSSYCQSLKKKDTVSIFEVKHSININKMD